MSSTQARTEEPPWLQAARREFGVKERFGTADNARILQYHAATRLHAPHDSVAWCSSFVCFVLEGVGITSTRSAAAASYRTWGQPCELKPGAIVVFGKADPDAGGTGHVAFCVSFDTDSVMVLGGNQRDAVSIARRPRDRIVAVRWPVTP
jgi:uncharacterized protein (TIGR02594 family)